MTYKLAFSQKDNYLHAKVTGQNSLNTVKSYLEEVLNKCKKLECSHILIEEQLEGPRLDVLEVFKIASEGSAHSRGYFNAIAYVDLNAEGDLMRFAETVAFNRALPVKVFATVNEAEKWLLQQD